MGQVDVATRSVLFEEQFRALEEGVDIVARTPRFFSSIRFVFACRLTIRSQVGTLQKLMDYVRRGKLVGHPKIPVEVLLRTFNEFSKKMCLRQGLV